MTAPATHPPRHASHISPLWHLGIEAGGTFTDGVALSPTGESRRAKVLSSGLCRLRCRPRGSGEWIIEPPGAATHWNLAHFRVSIGADAGWRVTHHEGDRLRLDRDHPGREPAVLTFSTGEPAAVLAARLAMGVPADQPLPPALVRLATTRATNALLQNRLTPVAFFVTRGFADLLLIGDQRRPDLFALEIRRAPLPYARVIEIDERLDAQGRVLVPLALQAARDAARAARASGCAAAAVALMHAWLNPDHERQLAEMLRHEGFEHVSVSSALSPRIKYVPRARTAVLDAALSGPIAGFIRGVRDGWPDPLTRVEVMTSAGGLVASDAFRPKDSLLSGPAGGAAGAAAIGSRAGFSRVIAFDMGGTSTDVTRIDADPEIAPAHSVGGFELLAPALAVHSVAAGGGSICALDLVSRPEGGGVRAIPRAGPRSAGADPGPACFGAGGPLTITDCNLLLGRLHADDFESPVFPEASREALRALAAPARQAGAPLPEDHALLEAFVRLADQRMAQAIHAISVRKGYDPRDYAMVAFGGAGGQHACAVAEALGIRRVLLPPDASVLCAAGLHAARVQHVEEAQVLASLADPALDLPARFAAVESRARAAFALAGHGQPPATTHRTLRVRVSGQDHALDLDWDPSIDARAAFANRAARVYGFPIEGRHLEAESIRVTLRGPPAPLPAHTPLPAPPPAPTVRDVCLDGAWTRLPVARADDAAALDSPLPGPAVVKARWTSLLLWPGWSARRLPTGDMLAEFDPAAAPQSRAPVHDDLTDALLAGRLDALAHAMGELLGRVALSTNVKERLDFSCAVLDPQGRLVISAPHIPVHLGALGVCVRRLMQVLPLGPHEVAITNHPAFGGSHLPDITLVAPAHADDGTLLGLVACRAHHADVGGTRPGSMPPDARSLAHEGVVFPPMRLARGDLVDWPAIDRLLRHAAFPARAPADNLADLAAQLAAIRMGVRGLREASREAGPHALLRAMDAVLDRAAQHAGEAITGLGAIDRTAQRAMDDGSPVRVRAFTRAHVERARQRAVLHLDFSGSAAVHPGNLNAPLGVIHSAVMYVLRLLVGRNDRGTDASVPLCDGLLAPVHLHVPPGMLNPPWDQLGTSPSSLPAVAGGNVETSQQVVNALLGALGLAADSQGTMNNLLFGDATRSHYETLGGGAGAGPGFAGAPAVHSHMTNTAITDPEVLERRFPVRLERFAVRHGSGGPGAFAGGDGLIREITFLEPMAVSLLGTHREPAPGPRGREGGGDGAPATQTLTRVDGQRVILPHAAAVDANPGDRLTIQTPGGGGWGAAGASG